MIGIILALAFSTCDSLSSELYNVETSFRQIEACSCIRRSELDDFRRNNRTTIKPASKCEALKERVDSLETRMKRTRKVLR